MSVLLWRGEALEAGALPNGAISRAESLGDSSTLVPSGQRGLHPQGVVNLVAATASAIALRRLT